jgi:hypothetical protein
MRNKMSSQRVLGSGAHSGSELSNYDTYYLATNTSYLGIVVTLSVDKDYSKQYVAGLKEMIATLHIYQR